MILEGNGLKIYSQVDKVENALRSIVIVHGLGEHLGRYDYFTKKLNEAGYNVYRFDQPGHGHNEGARGDVKSYMDFALATKLLVDYAKKDSPNLDVYLFGHSMGGFTVNLYGVTYPNTVKAIVSSGAPGIILKMVKPLRFIPYNLLGFINNKNNLAKLTTHDLEIVKSYETDSLVLKKIKIHLLGNVFIDGVKHLQKNITKLVDPIFYIHGEDDKIVEKESSIWLYNHISSQDKELKIYPKMYHELLNETIKDDCINDILSFLEKR